MAAFSFQHYPFVLDSAGLPNPTIKISGLLQEGEMNDSLIFPFYQYDSLPDYAFSPTANASGCFGNGATAVAEKLTIDSSSVVTQADGVDHVAHQQAPVDKKRKSRDGSCLNSPESKEGKGRKQKKCGSSMIKTEEKKPKAEKKSHKKACEDPPTDYIHVRARRGQATDSHSLAERVRREKISERMRQLQGLVPGCDKVIGKALMLDEIINYVQSLQNQVEFLSTKLALYDFGADLSDCTANSQGLGIPSTFPCRQQSPAFRDSTTAAVPTANSYLLMDGRDPLLLQGQRPDAFPQENSNLVWEMEDQRNGIASPAGYCNICSFQEKDYPPNICL